MELSIGLRTSLLRLGEDICLTLKLMLITRLINWTSHSITRLENIRVPIFLLLKKVRLKLMVRFHDKFAQSKS